MVGSCLYAIMEIPTGLVHLAYFLVCFLHLNTRVPAVKYDVENQAFLFVKSTCAFLLGTSDVPNHIYGALRGGTAHL